MFVNDEGVIEKRDIEIGVSDDMNIQIVSGLTANDVIVESRIPIWKQAKTFQTMPQCRDT